MDIESREAIKLETDSAVNRAAIRESARRPQLDRPHISERLTAL
jgi:hypothetical protein